MTNESVCRTCCRLESDHTCGTLHGARMLVEGDLIICWGFQPRLTTATAFPDRGDAMKNEYIVALIDSAECEYRAQEDPVGKCCSEHEADPCWTCQAKRALQDLQVELDRQQRIYTK